MRKCKKEAFTVKIASYIMNELLTFLMLFENTNISELLTLKIAVYKVILKWCLLKPREFNVTCFSWFYNYFLSLPACCLSLY